MSKNARNLTAFVGGILIMLFVVVCTTKQARAGCYKCTINYVTEVIEKPMTIIEELVN